MSVHQSKIGEEILSKLSSNERLIYNNVGRAVDQQFSDQDIQSGKITADHVSIYVTGVLTGIWLGQSAVKTSSKYFTKEELNNATKAIVSMILANSTAALQ